MRRVPIRLKLAGALAVPLTALVAVTVLEVVQTSTARSDIRQQTELARTVVGPTGLLITLQNERTWPSVEILEFDDSVTVPVEGYEETRAQTDAARAAFEEQLAGRSETIARAFREALDGLARLDELRAEIDAFHERRHSTRATILFGYEVFDRYTEMITPFFDATRKVAKAVEDSDLRQGAELSDAVSREIETTSLLAYTTIAHALLSEGGVDQPAEITDLSILRSDMLEQAAVLRAAHGPYAEIARERYPQELIAGLDAQVDTAVTTHRISVDDLLAVLDMPRNEGLYGYQAAVHEVLTDRANDLDARAESRRVWLAALAVLTVALAAGLTWLISHSITAPLRSLTRQAKELAGWRLPDAVRDVLETPLGEDVRVPELEPVLVETNDEVADVADALNTVQDSALDLAVEQAVLRRNIADSFVNLGRRNQNLLGRQLDFITELEARETSPDALVGLFQLDHLATRMRRNAESLLVLAGVEPPRKWAAPVRLADVVRSALGEVEEYQRVAVHDLEPVTILGSAAADLTHLVAELVENALTFSPAGSQVQVRGQRRSDTGGYALVIVDHGPGMSPGELAQANRRLAGNEAFTVAPSKYLGHYVAGNLARRLGAHVWLAGTPGGGTTVTIDLAPALVSGAVEGDPSTPPNATPTIAARAALDAGRTPDTNEPSPPPDPSAPPVRTASGLVKRVPGPVRSRSGRRPVPARSLNGLTGEMLAALTEHAARARADARRPGGPTVPPSVASAPARSAPARPAPARSAPAPSPPAAGRPLAAAGPADGRVPVAGGTPARSGDGAAGAAGDADSRVPAVGGPPRPAYGGPTTASGLIRRVRGAQMPASDPLLVSRGPDAPDTVAERNGDEPADDVYSLLSQFTSGVQRGLDEAALHPTDAAERGP